ncbi:MAG: hypothetical protein R3Y63_03330 [Eubacteriales bacterium]
MANMLGITNPVPGQDRPNNVQNQQILVDNPKLQNVPDPTKIIKSDNKSEQQSSSEGDGSKKLQFSSNFSTFAQKLNESKNLNETLAEVMLKFAKGAEQGPITAALAEMMEMLKMDEEQLGKFITDQLSSGNRFGGALFNALREVFISSTSPTLKEDVLQFLKAFSNYTSTDHVETNVLRTLDKLTHSIPASYGNKLASMTGELAETLEKGDREGAIKLLQGKIIPFVGDYTKRTHDMGLSRTLISVLTFNTARLEGGSEEQLLNAFHQMNTHGPLRSKFGGLSDTALLRLIQGSAFMQGEEVNPFASLLIEATGEAMTGDSGSEIQEVFKQVLDTFLLNESVYVPLNHLTIPLDWGGVFLFSQMWVDPDAEDNLKKGKDDEDPIAKIFLKMDVEGLGLFDLVVATQNGDTEMILHCPEIVANHSKIVAKDISEILRDNGLKPKDIYVGKMHAPLQLAQVFPKIYEGETSVDVKA